MHDECRNMLRAAFQFIDGQQRALNQLLIVTQALLKAVKETSPELHAAYSQQYSIESSGSIRAEGDEIRSVIAQLIRKLTD